MVWFRHIPITELSVKYGLEIREGWWKNVNIETLDALKQALIKLGYSRKAVREIIKWYQ